MLAVWQKIRGKSAESFSGLKDIAQQLQQLGRSGAGGRIVAEAALHDLRHLPAGLLGHPGNQVLFQANSRAAGLARLPLNDQPC